MTDQEKKEEEEIAQLTPEEQESYEEAFAFYSKLPDLYRLAKLSYTAERDKLISTQDSLYGVMSATKKHLITLTTSNQTSHMIQDIVDDEIDNCPECDKEDGEKEESTESETLEIVD
jgi:hypothetical protein